MVVLTANEAFVSAKPILRVDNKLKPGRHLFQLVAVDTGNNKSKPARLVVEIAEERPTPPPAPFNPRDPRIFRPDAVRPVVLNPDLAGRIRINRPPR